MIIYTKRTSKDDLLKLNIVLEKDVKIGKGVKLHHGCCVLGCSVLEDGCEIGNNSVITNSHIGKGVKVLSSFVEDSLVGESATVGPFATIKKNSNIGGGCRIGNFVEVKNSIVGERTKIAHLAYVGDAELGCGCNIGCGVVFCNYNGNIKQKSRVGNKVFIGSNVNIVAPVNIEDFSYIAAGSTINKDVFKNQFAIARSLQINKDNFDNPFLKRWNFSLKW